MSVTLHTSVGPLTIKLYCDKCPLTCKNFLKLCKIKYYDNCLFYNIQKDYIVQTGDPYATGSGGTSIYGLLDKNKSKYFDDEIVPELKHNRIGTVAMANAGPNLNASEFYITTCDSITSLNGKHTIFGYVVDECIDTLMKINNAIVDEKGRPLQILRIRSAEIIEDPFPDPENLKIPEESPAPKPGVFDGLLPEDAVIEDLDEEERLERLAEYNARSKAELLALIGDRPDADVKPPDNVLFVCKLNPDTNAEDLKVIFSRFGDVRSVDIIRDPKTGNSLCYGFVEFEEKEACEEAYFKMQNVIVDNRRIHVDFSQSVAKNTDWKAYGGWKNYFRDRAKKYNREDSSRKDSSRKSSYLDKYRYRHRKESKDRKYDFMFDDHKPSSKYSKKRRDYYK